MKNVVLLLLLVGLISCRKEKTAWDSNWQFPILSDTMDLKNWTKDSIVSVNANGSYQLIINRELMNVNLDSILRLPDTTIQQKTALSIPSVTLSPGTSFINKINNNEFHLNDVQLKQVNLRSGTAEITIFSPIQGRTILNLILPGVTKDGVVFSQQLTAEAGTLANPSVVKTSLDLSGYSIDLRSSTGSSYNTIQSQLQVKTDPNGGSIHVTNQDSIIFQASFSNLKPSYTRGYFGQLLFADTSSVNLDFMQNITAGTIDLQQTKLTLAVSNGLKVTARSKIDFVEGTSNAQNTLSLTQANLGIWRVINQATGTWDNLHPGVLSWLFDDNNSSITPFLENLPRTLKLAYALEMNPLGDDSGGWNEYFSTSRIKINLLANMPLALGINQLTYCDTFDLQLKQNTDKTHVKSGQILVKAVNAYSFNAKLKLIALDANNQVIFSKMANGDILGSSKLDNYNPTEQIRSQAQFDLSEEETVKLSNMRKMVLQAVFETPQNGQIARIYSSQFIFLQLLSNIQLTTKF
jgi:hypothetical protein